MLHARKEPSFGRPTPLNVAPPLSDRHRPAFVATNTTSVPLEPSTLRSITVVDGPTFTSGSHESPPLVDLATKPPTPPAKGSRFRDRACSRCRQRRQSRPPRRTSGLTSATNQAAETGSWSSSTACRRMSADNEVRVGGVDALGALLATVDGSEIVGRTGTKGTKISGGPSLFDAGRRITRRGRFVLRPLALFAQCLGKAFG